MNKELKQKIEESADEYAFQVPYDGTKEFYDQTKLSGFKAGAQFLLDEGVRFTKEDMISFAEYHNKAWYEIPAGLNFETWLEERKSK